VSDAWLALQHGAAASCAGLHGTRSRSGASPRRRPAGETRVEEW